MQIAYKVKKTFSGAFCGKETWNKWLEIENLTRFEMLRENISLLMRDRLDEGKCSSTRDFVQEGGRVFKRTAGIINLNKNWS